MTENNTHDQQILHLDVKPANFLIPERDWQVNQCGLVLADFGIARLSQGSGTVSQTVRGTPQYMAPEQWRGQPTAASDQYALAAMAYELLLGKPPFVGTMEQLLYQHTQRWPLPPSRINPALTYLDVVLLQALAKPPEWRYPSVSKFAQEFWFKCFDESIRESWLHLIAEHAGAYVPDE